MSKVKIGMLDFADAVSGMLEEEIKVVNNNAERIAEQTAKETAEVVRQSASFSNRSGKYIKSIKSSAEGREIGKKVFIVSAKSGNYRLSHLLEDGHKTPLKHGKFGKAQKTRAFPHFSAGAEFADKRIEELARELVDEN